MAQFASNKVAGPLLAESQHWLAGKGGGRLIDAANRANLLGASLIGASTDLPARRSRSVKRHVHGAAGLAQ